ncbi:MAG: hypothetical protein HQL50_06710 [Magnetococcales bacterium]|nr:hypothetical protein [Magnetococcales bacterium]
MQTPYHGSPHQNDTLTWQHRLALLPFWIVPMVGLLLIFVAKFGFEQFYADASVTISQTVGFSPNRLLAAVAGAIIGLNLTACHLLVFRYNRFHLEQLHGNRARVPGWLPLANRALLVCVVWASTAISLTLIFPSNDSPALHEFLSYNLFIFCTATTVLDGHVAGRWRLVETTNRTQAPWRQGTRLWMFVLRRGIASTLVALSLSYLVLFLGREQGWLADNRQLTQLYVLTEYAIILSYYLYVFAYYFEFRAFCLTAAGRYFPRFEAHHSITS